MVRGHNNYYFPQYYFYKIQRYYVCIKINVMHVLCDFMVINYVVIKNTHLAALNAWGWLEVPISMSYAMNYRGMLWLYVWFIIL